ncbi:MAG: sigma-70 family RNA polymerase sigma factor [Clostridia bacterium]|nr:sigma-70 family RNA polymerase sigma factor [Clostridia bacterium]
MDAQKFNRLLKKIKYNKKAVDSIYDEYSPKLKLHFQRRFGNLINPEDTVEDVFLKLLEMETPNHVEFPTAWLFRLADNYIIDELRTKHQDEQYFENISEEFDLEHIYVDIEVKVALSKLDNLTQQLLYLHFWEGYSYKELATEFKLSYSCVRTRVSRSYKILKTIL